MRARLLRRRLISGRDYFVNLIYSYATHITRVLDFISRKRILVLFQYCYRLIIPHFSVAQLGLTYHCANTNCHRRRKHPRKSSPQ